MLKFDFAFASFGRTVDNIGYIEISLLYRTQKKVLPLLLQDGGFQKRCDVGMCLSCQYGITDIAYDCLKCRSLYRNLIIG